MTSGHTIKITDPVQSLERIYLRINEQEQFLAEYESRNWKASAAGARRRIAALKAAATRISKLI